MTAQPSHAWDVRASWGWFLRLVWMGARRPRWIVALGLGFPLLVVASYFLRGPRYTSTSSFTPESGGERSLGQVVGRRAARDIPTDTVVTDSDLL